MFWDQPVQVGNFAQQGRRHHPDRGGSRTWIRRFSIGERLKIIRDVQVNTLFPKRLCLLLRPLVPPSVAMFPFSPRRDFGRMGWTNCRNITLLNPRDGRIHHQNRWSKSGRFVYSAFMNRNRDPLHTPPRASRFRRSTTVRKRTAPAPIRETIRTSAAAGLFTFDETITGAEFELFWSPNDNLQFVMNYSHVQREAKDDFCLFGLREPGGFRRHFHCALWRTPARVWLGPTRKMQGAWVGLCRLQTPLVSSGDGFCGDQRSRRISGGTDSRLSKSTKPSRFSEFASRNNAGQIFSLRRQVRQYHQ